MLSGIELIIRTATTKRPLPAELMFNLQHQGFKSVTICNDYIGGEPINAFSSLLKGKSKSDLYLILEDDAEVSAVFKQEVEALLERVRLVRNLGILRLCNDTVADFLAERSDYIHTIGLFKRYTPIHYTAGVIVTRKVIDSFLNKYPSGVNYGKSFDLALTKVALEEGLDILLTAPSIVRSNASMESSLGNTHKAGDEFYFGGAYYSEGEALSTDISVKLSLLLNIKRQDALQFT